MLKLITDRTQSDVAFKTKKGYYNAEDLNRVSQAVDYLVSVLDGLGHSVPGYVKFLTWSQEVIPSKSQMEQYRANVAAIRSVIAMLPETPEAPETMEKFTYKMANDLEKILLDVEKLIESLSMIFPKSNGFFSISGACMYVPEMEYILCDSEGIELHDNNGIALTVR